jgi:hypothetical protein
MLWSEAGKESRYARPADRPAAANPSGKGKGTHRALMGSRHHAAASRRHARRGTHNDHASCRACSSPGRARGRLDGVSACREPHASTHQPPAGLPDGSERANPPFGWQALIMHSDRLGTAGEPAGRLPSDGPVPPMAPGGRRSRLSLAAFRSAYIAAVCSVGHPRGRAADEWLKRVCLR